MKLNNLTRIALGLMLAVLTSCAVHEWPSPEDVVPFRIKFSILNIEWELMDRACGDDISDTRGSNQAKLRYTIRLVPVTKMMTDKLVTQEFVMLKELDDDTELEISADVAPGTYDVLVWADYVRAGSGEPYYNIDNFAAITYNGTYEGNNDYHDAFRGVARIELIADIMDNAPDELSIYMQRPFAKFELITNDIDAFITSEISRRGLPAGSQIDLSEYTVVYQYVGFYPDTYNMFTDKPIDASSGVSFTSSITKLDDSTATLGFDYVFVGDGESVVTVQVGVYDKDGVEVSRTESIKVPLNRSQHSLVHGDFLMSTASGGVNVDSSYNGDHNIVIQRRLGK